MLWYFWITPEIILYPKSKSMRDPEICQLPFRDTEHKCKLKRKKIIQDTSLCRWDLCQKNQLMYRCGLNHYPESIFIYYLPQESPLQWNHNIYHATTLPLDTQFENNGKETRGWGRHLSLIHNRVSRRLEINGPGFAPQIHHLPAILILLTWTSFFPLVKGD